MAGAAKMSEHLVDELLRIYARVEHDLRRILGSADATDFLRGRAGRLLHQIEQVMRGLKQHHRRWAVRAIRLAAVPEIEGAAPDQDPRFALIDRQSIHVLAERIVLDLDRAVDGIPRELGTILRRTQQEATGDAALLRQTARARAEGATREELARRIAQTLRDGAVSRLRHRLPAELAARLRAIADGHYVPIIGKDGRLRRYSLRAYAELVGATWTMAAANEATLRFAQRYGMDLVRVSVHANVPDEPCQRVQGKIYSISGRHPDFPRLDFALPLHPHCRHRFTAVNEDTLRERGQYDRLVAFSTSDRTVVDFRAYQEMLRR